LARNGAHFFRGITHAWGRQTVGKRDPVTPSNKSFRKTVNDLLFFFPDSPALTQIRLADKKGFTQSAAITF